jgi:hypothetical protein
MIYGIEMQKTIDTWRLSTFVRLPITASSMLGHDCVVLLEYSTYEFQLKLFIHHMHY